jgi:hypothetical protein
MPRFPRSLTHAPAWVLALGAVTLTAQTPSAIQQRETGLRSRSTAVAGRAATLASCATASGAICTQPFYDLGPSSVAAAINNVGEVVGSALNGSGVLHASIFNEYLGRPPLPSPLLAHGVTDLGALSGSTNSSSGYAISDLWNSSGFLNATPYAAGQSNSKAFRWAGAITQLAAPFSSGYGVDLQGDVTGQQFDASQNLDFAISWLSSGQQIMQPPPKRGSISSGQSIVTLASSSNAPVAFVGYQETKTGANGFLYNSATGKLSVIRPLSGDSDLVPRAMTTSLIVGNSHDVAGHQHAFFARITGGIPGAAKALPTLASGAQSFASGVNPRGYIVGYESNASGTSARIWKPIGTNGSYVAIDLNTLVLPPPPWYLENAVGINDRDQVTGIGTNDGGSTHRGFLALLNRQVIDVSGAVLTASSVQALAYLGYDLIVQEIWAPKQRQLPNVMGNLSAIATAGYKNAVYIFLRFDNPTRYPGTLQMNQALAGLAGYVNTVHTSFLALDVEYSAYDGRTQHTTPAQRIKIIADAIAAATPSGIPIVIYTSDTLQPVWDTLIGLKSPSSQRFSTCALWDAKADNISDLEVDLVRGRDTLFTPYGVWTDRYAKQHEIYDSNPNLSGEDLLGIYAFTNSVGSQVMPVDVSSFDWTFFSTTSSCVTGSAQ